MATWEDCGWSSIILRAPIGVSIWTQRVILVSLVNCVQPSHGDSSAPSNIKRDISLDIITSICLGRKARDDMYSIEHIPPNIPGLMSV